MTRYRVSLRIWHPTYLPETISQALEVPPTTTRAFGTERRSTDGRTLSPLAETYWSSTFPDDDDESLNKILERMCSWLSRHREFLQRIRSTGGRSEVFTGVFFTQNAGETISLHVIEQLAHLRLDLGLDLYGSDVAIGLDSDLKPQA